jgi:dihydroorotate dehydrogenase
MKELAGYEIEVPFGPAAGVVNGPNLELLAERVKDCLRSPVSAGKFGSITWEGGPGNEGDYGVVYYHNPVTGQTVNSMGLPNVGFHVAVREYPELRKFAEALGKPLVPSLSPGKGEDPVMVLPRMAEGFAEAGAPAIEINYSCPNKITGEGAREPILAYDVEQMAEIDGEIVRVVGTGVAVIRKLAPYVGEKKLLIPKVGELYAQAGGDVWLNLSNTIGGQRIPNEMGDPALKVPDNMGGMSGPYTAEMARDQLIRFKKILPAGIGVISCNGVIDGSEVFHRTDELRADLTEGATVYFENERRGISYGQTGQRVAEQYAEAVDASA